MSHARTAVLTLLAMLAFAANSLLCRAALGSANIDAASFTSIRLMSGAITLWLIVRMTVPAGAGNGSWLSALALLVYAACFSFAYVSLSAATGALLLFAAVQATMIGYGLWAGERLSRNQIGGVLLAAGGVVGLMLPGLSAPPVLGAMRACRGTPEPADGRALVHEPVGVLVRGGFGSTGVRDWLCHLVRRSSLAEGDDRRDGSVECAGHRRIGRRHSSG